MVYILFASIFSFIVGIVAAKAHFRYQLKKQIRIVQMHYEIELDPKKGKYPVPEKYAYARQMLRQLEGVI